MSPVDFEKVPCRPVEFKKRPCRPVDSRGLDSNLCMNTVCVCMAEYTINVHIIGDIIYDWRP